MLDCKHKMCEYVYVSHSVFSVVNGYAVSCQLFLECCFVLANFSHDPASVCLQNPHGDSKGRITVCAFFVT